MSGSVENSESPDAAADATLAERVRAAATQLVTDLQQAELASANWRDEQIGFDQIQAALATCITQLCATNCLGEANRLPSSILWELANPFLVVGELQHQARTKPRGYAGDFELLKKICDGYRCEHPLGRLFDRFFQAQAAPQAVRNRTRLIADLIVKTVRESKSPRCKVVSVGCSAAVDIEWALHALSPAERSRLDVVLLDIDPAAIAFCERHLGSLLPAKQLVTARENLFRLPQLPRLHPLLAESQLLFCAGLFDYLVPLTANAMLRTFWQSLTHGGRMLVFNFGPNNPSRGYMEWIGNWYLTYRTVAELKELGNAAELPADSLVVSAESTGVNLYLDVQKNL